MPIMPIFSSLSSSKLCGTVSKAFLRSRKMPMQYLLSFRAVDMELRMCMSACSVDLFLEKPYWYLQIYCVCYLFYACYTKQLSVVHQSAVYRMELCLFLKGILQRKARPRVSGQ